jgi:hypothetical protein
MISDHMITTMLCSLQCSRVGQKQRARNKQTQRAKTQSYSCEV